MRLRSQIRLMEENLHASCRGMSTEESRNLETAFTTCGRSPEARGPEEKLHGQQGRSIFRVFLLLISGQTNWCGIHTAKLKWLMW